MIDHNSLVEPTEPRSIGRYGTLDNPAQFKYPRGIAIDINDELYVADSKNSRVQLMSLDGNPVRKPIYLGKNFHPTSLTVSLDRQVFISDSHVVRVYSSSGELTFANLKRIPSNALICHFMSIVDSLISYFV